MDNLFSHAPVDPPDGPAPEAADGLEPVVYTVVVPGAVARAFVGFTEHTHLWWPLEDHSVYGAGSYVEFEENLIMETADDGRTAVWGSIDDWQPPLSFHASWHPGTTAIWSTELRVAFKAVGGAQSSAWFTADGKAPRILLPPGPTIRPAGPASWSGSFASWAALAPELAWPVGRIAAFLPSCSEGRGAEPAGFAGFPGRSAGRPRNGARNWAGTPPRRK